MSIREGIIILVLGGLAGAAWWFSWSSRLPEPVRESDASSPDFYMDGTTIVMIGRGGHRGNELRADTLVHYPGDDSTNLTNPVLTVYKKDSAPWTVVSEAARVSSGGNLILFQGKVTISRGGTQGDRPLQLITRNLRWRPDDSYAETDEHASLRSGANTLDGVGMEAWLDSPVRLTLLSRVRSVYERD